MRQQPRERVAQPPAVAGPQETLKQLLDRVAVARTQRDDALAPAHGELRLDQRVERVGERRAPGDARADQGYRTLERRCRRTVPFATEHLGERRHTSRARGVRLHRQLGEAPCAVAVPRRREPVGGGGEQHGAHAGRRRRGGALERTGEDRRVAPGGGARPAGRGCRPASAPVVDGRSHSLCERGIRSLQSRDDPRPAGLLVAHSAQPGDECVDAHLRGGVLSAVRAVQQLTEGRRGFRRRGIGRERGSACQGRAPLIGQWSGVEAGQLHERPGSNVWLGGPRRTRLEPCRQRLEHPELEKDPVESVGLFPLEACVERLVQGRREAAHRVARRRGRRSPSCVQS